LDFVVRDGRLVHALAGPGTAKMHAVLRRSSRLTPLIIQCALVPRWTAWRNARKASAMIERAPWYRSIVIEPLAGRQ
jgi:hypothetical protein